MIKVSIVIPVYFNEQSLRPLMERLTQVMESDTLEFEVIFVDDGSQDNSFAILQSFAEKDDRIKVIRLSRNFGSFTACLAGLRNISGDCAVVISADLQDPPELIPDMVREWQADHKVVLAVREKRKDKLLVKLAASLYYRLMKKFAIKDMPLGGFDFFLIDRKVAEIISSIKEKNTSLSGLVLWVGFKKKLLYYTRQERTLGISMWTLSKKIKYFIDSFTGFSYFPLRLASITGIGIALMGFLYGILVILLRLFFQEPPTGWSALMVVVLVLGGFQLLTLGMVGEYLWRNFDETRKRPIYIIDETLGIQDPK